MSEDTPLNQWSLDDLLKLQALVEDYEFVPPLPKQTIYPESIGEFYLKLKDVIKTAISDAEQLEEERWVNGFVLPDEMRRNELKKCKHGG